VGVGDNSFKLHFLPVLDGKISITVSGTKSADYGIVRFGLFHEPVSFQLCKYFQGFFTLMGCSSKSDHITEKHFICVGPKLSCFEEYFPAFV
jgi:hypothetical protein